MDRYKLTFDTYNNIAKIYEDKFMNMDLYNDTYDLFCNLVPQPGARIFEVACGPGNITRYLAQQRPDLKIEATDIAPNMIELAEKNVPTAQFRLLDARNIDQVEPGFNGIICGFGLPYFSREDCAKFFRDCATLLEDDGILYCSFVPGSYDQSGYRTGNGNQIYFYYHPEGEILAQLKTNNFELVKQMSVDYLAASDGNHQVHTVIIARKVKPE
jgi:ubiquinone/menaquinone biosynthesis C-methylase UbiE